VRLVAALQANERRGLLHRRGNRPAPVGNSIQTLLSEQPDVRFASK
jgi:hypothetical protein